MTFQISPGVYTREIDLSGVIPAVSTSTGAFAGAFKWGPVAKPVLVSDEAALINAFRATESSSQVDFLTAASFLAYSNALQTSRVVGTGYKNAIAGAAASGTAVPTPGTGGIVYDNEDAFEERTVGTANFVARYPGALGNALRVYIIRNSAAAAAVKTASTAALTTSFGKVDRDILVSINSIISNKVPGTSVDIRAQTGLANAGDEAHIFVVDYQGRFSGVKGTVLESYLGVSVAKDARTADGGPNFYADVINATSQYVYVDNSLATGVFGANVGVNAEVGTTYPSTNTSFNVYALGGGNDGAAVTAADYQTAYAVFADPEAIDISLVIAGAAESTTVQYLIDNIAEVRQDCVVFFSPLRTNVVNVPQATAVSNTIAYRETVDRSTSYAFMDSGWKYMFNRYSNTFAWVPLCGDTAGLCARTDRERDAWWSPAGFNRGNIKNIVKLAYSPNEAQRDDLYTAEINPVVTFPGRGTVLFGDKTLLDRASAFDRINVRRLFIVLKKAISRASQFQLFEFNDQFTRAQFVSIVEPFLRDVQGRRGIFAFKVICDETNNTPNVIDLNTFIGDIFIQPAKSINFIRLNFIATRTGVDFNEVVGAA